MASVWPAAARTCSRGRKGGEKREKREKRCQDPFSGALWDLFQTKGGDMTQSISWPTRPLNTVSHGTGSEYSFRFVSFLTRSFYEALVLLGAMYWSEPISGQEHALPSGSKAGAVLKAHAGGVTCIALSRDGSALATYGVDKLIRLRDVASGREHRISEAGVMSLAFSPDGKMLAAGEA